MAKVRWTDKGWKKVLAAGRAIDGREISVGIHADKTYPGGTPVALVGYVHEYGVGVPMRPWLTQLTDATQRDALRLSAQVAALVSPMVQAVALERAREELQALYRQKFAGLKLTPLDESTVLRKLSATPLVDTGRLRESIEARIEEDT